MKFHCDRCHTRYSIADERVRGKILKIRCKQCGAIITVRESSDTPRSPKTSRPTEQLDTAAVLKRLTASSQAAVSPDPATRQTGDIPASAGPAGRAGTPPAARAKIPSPARSATPSPARAETPPPARAATPRPSAPAIEWYVSMDGEQEGPFTREQARAWIAARSPDDALYCWNEDFEDWKSVEDVEWFRALRRRSRPVPVVAPSRGAPSPPPRAQPDDDPDEDDDLDMFDSATTVDDSPFVAHRDPSARDPRAVLGLAMSRPLSEPPKALGAPPRLASPPSLAPASPSRATGPAASQPSGQTTREPPRQGSSQRSKQKSRKITSAEAFEPTRPAVPKAPPDLFPAPGRRGAVSVVSPRAGAAGGNGAAQAQPHAAEPAPLDARRDSAAEPTDDLELDISEPSRIINLSVLAGQAGAGGARPAGGKSAGMPGSAIGRGTGSAGSIAAGASAAMPSLVGALSPLPAGMEPPVVDVRGRRSVVPALLGVLLVVAIVAGVLFYLRGGDDSDEVGASVRKRNFENLGYSVDTPGRRGDSATTPDAGAAKSPRPRVVRRPAGPSPRTNGNASSGDPGGQTAGTSGSGDDPGPALGPGGEPLRKLTPDDVIRVSSKNAIGSKRCYESALKKNPFLKVSKIEITLAVDKAGKVTSVALSDHADSPLGLCLAARIRGWRFPANTSGINTRIPLVFEQN